mgnify:CR=1 FL=1|jgi:hypothetical protein
MTNDANFPDEFKKLSESEQQDLINWCYSIAKIKSINLKRTSYGLKHIFENSKNGFYITNGAFKGAMLECGFDYKPVSSSSPNWHFNVSEKSIKDLKN